MPFTQTGPRPDLAALPVNLPEGYIGNSVFPVSPVADKSGTIYYATVTADSAAQTGRSAGTAPTGTQISDSSTTYTAAEAIKRGSVTPDEAKQFGIEVVDVRIKRVDFASTITDSVYRRMESERKRVANETRSTGAAEGEKIRADADRQREVIVAEAYRDAQKIMGEGDAKASELYAEAFGRDPNFAQFYRQLTAYKASFKSKTDVMVVDPSSDFFKTLRGPGSAPAAPARK